MTRSFYTYTNSLLELKSRFVNSWEIVSTLADHLIVYMRYLRGFILKGFIVRVTHKGFIVRVIVKGFIVFKVKPFQLIVIAVFVCLLISSTHKLMVLNID